MKAGRSRGAQALLLLVVLAADPAGERRARGHAPCAPAAPALPHRRPGEQAPHAPIQAPPRDLVDGAREPGVALQVVDIGERLSAGDVEQEHGLHHLRRGPALGGVIGDESFDGVEKAGTLNELEREHEAGAGGKRGGVGVGAELDREPLTCHAVCTSLVSFLFVQTLSSLERSRRQRGTSLLTALAAASPGL